VKTAHLYFVAFGSDVDKAFDLLAALNIKAELVDFESPCYRTSEIPSIDLKPVIDLLKEQGIIANL
jgi:hypothetical protein